MTANAPLTQSLQARVLIVDDDEEFLRVFVRQVKRLGYVVDGAGDAATALALSKEHHYDVALIDLRMQMNGLELMDRIAARSPHTSFILMTGATDVRDEDTRSVGQRLTAVLLKPFEETDLEAALQQAIHVTSSRSGAHQPEAPVRVLLVEDSLTDALLLKHAMRIHGNYEVTHVVKLSEAVRLLHDQQFDTVITDLSLPDALGLGAVVRLRESAPEVTLVVCSAAADENLALRAIELGAQDFVVKGALDETFGRVLRLARVRRRAEQRLVRLAHTDALTGLANRAAFSEVLERSVMLAKRDNSTLALMYIDLDGFKAINDEYGHEAGDDLLREVARRIQGCLREYDVAARLGGDEFAIVVQRLAEHEVEQLAQRVLQAVALPVESRSRSLEVAASLGVACYPKDASESAVLLRAADEAMYSVKRRGREQRPSSERTLVR